jgi:phosphomethylpyrimidine synthase
MTLIEKIRSGKIPNYIKKVAKKETVKSSYLCSSIKSGKAVVPKNKIHTLERVCAIGKGFSTKVNANIGTSEGNADLCLELNKLKLAEDLGADAIMDLSTSFDLVSIRKKILEKTRIPLGTVPIYEIAVLGRKQYGRLERIPDTFFIETLRKQARDGVDFFTIHSGVTRKTVSILQKSKRIMGMVSRGGALTMEWMLKNSKENPFYSHFDEVLDIAKEFDVTLSLGDGMRPGAINDANDKPQIDELKLLGLLQQKAFKKGVQVMIEGPGHVPLNKIKENVELEKKICNGAPFYVLGPLVTDIAPGYDHITGAIGGALAAGYGADFLCYVTPAEHLRLPTLKDVEDGVVASKIAAHAGDIVKKIPGALSKDTSMSKARFLRDWEAQFKLSINPEKSREYRRGSKSLKEDVCSMCGDYCSLKISEKFLR